MPLESLSDEQINIHDLTLEQEKKPLSEAETIYDNLKTTKRYISSENVWSEGDQDWVFNVKTQLLDLLVRSRLDEEKILDQYRLFCEKCKDTPGLLRFVIKKPMFEDQCLDLILNYIIDAGKAKTEYNQKIGQLRPLYFNEKYQRWTSQPTKENSIPDYCVKDQLYFSLVQSFYEPENAVESLEKLKNNSTMYDEEKELFYKSREFADEYSSENELINVLVTAKSNSKKARQRYEKLKELPFYDKKEKIWYQGYYGRVISDKVNKNNTIIRHIQTSSQLLGILCEQEFEESELSLESSTPPLPEIRSY